MINCGGLSVFWNLGVLFTVRNVGAIPAIQHFDAITKVSNLLGGFGREVLMLECTCFIKGNIARVVIFNGHE